MLTTRECVVEGIANFYNISPNYIRDEDQLCDMGMKLDDEDWFALKDSIEDCLEAAPNLAVGRLNQCLSVGEIVKYVTSMM